MERHIRLKKYYFTIFLCSFLFISSHAQDSKNLLSSKSIVFIEANDEGVESHAKDEILYWGYWKSTYNKKNADIILILDATFSLYYTINATIVDAKTQSIIKKFDSVNSFKKWDGNPKRGAISALFEKEIIPYIHSLQY